MRHGVGERSQSINERLALIDEMFFNNIFRDDVKIHRGEPVAWQIFLFIYGVKANHQQKQLIARAVKSAIKNDLPLPSIILLSLVFGEKICTPAELKPEERYRDDSMGWSAAVRLDGALCIIEQKYRSYGTAIPEKKEEEK